MVCKICNWPSAPHLFVGEDEVCSQSPSPRTTADDPQDSERSRSHSGLSSQIVCIMSGEVRNLLLRLQQQFPHTVLPGATPPSRVGPEKGVVGDNDGPVRGDLQVGEGSGSQTSDCPLTEPSFCNSSSCVVCLCDVSHTSFLQNGGNFSSICRGYKRAIAYECHSLRNSGRQKERVDQRLCDRNGCLTHSLASCALSSHLCGMVISNDDSE
jgi:hypothetical protein